MYPKENIEWLNWINQGKMIYGNKEKLQALIAQQRMNVADVNSQVVQSPLHEHCLESVENILQKFGDVKEIYTDGYLFYEEIREQSKIEQKFFAYYTEKGNLDARELSTVEADEFYTALKNNDIAKIDEYKKNDLHEISELANEIFLDYTKNNPKIVNKIKKPEQLIYTSTEIGQMVERITGKQLVTVNLTRVNENIVPPKANISQNEEKSINKHNSMEKEQNEDKIQKMALSKGVLESLTEIGNTIKNDSAMILKSPSFGDVTFSTGVFGDLSKKNNGGYGINHIVEGRYVKDGLTQQDIASLLYLIKDAVETTTVEIDDSKSRQNIIKDGIWVTVRKDFDGIKQNWIVTGFAENDEKGQITKEATDAIKAVNAQYGYAPEHLFVSEQVGAVIASLNNVAQNILMSSDEERIKNFKEVYKNTQFLDSVIKNENTFTKEATDTIQEWEEMLDDNQKAENNQRNVALINKTQEERPFDNPEKELTFSQQVDLVLAGKYNRFNALKVCDTPQIFLDVGLKQLPILYTQNHLRDALHKKSKENPHWHGLTTEQMKQIPELLKSPAIIMDSLNNDGSIVAVLAMRDSDNAPLFATIKPNGFGTYNYEFVDSNFMLSVYGKETGFERYIERAAKENKILYWSKEKSQDIQCAVLLLEQGLNELDSEKILHQTNSVVNTQSQKNTLFQKPNVVNKIKKPEQLIYTSTEIGQMVERITGKQLVTVNPTRVNENIVPPKTNISQGKEKSTIINNNEKSQENHSNAKKQGISIFTPRQEEEILSMIYENHVIGENLMNILYNKKRDLYDEIDKIASEKTNGRPDIALNQLYHDKFDEYKINRDALVNLTNEDIVMQHKALEDEWIAKRGKIDVNDYYRERSLLNDEIRSRNISGGDYWNIVKEQKSNIQTLNDYADALKYNHQLVFNNPDLGKIIFDNGVFGNPNKDFKGGYGIKHLIASRSQKDNMSVDEISALLLKVKEIVESVKPEDPSKAHLNLIKDGIWVGISKQWNGTDETWIITGFPEKENENTFTKEATDTIQTVIAQNSYALEHSSIREQVGAVIDSIPIANEKSTIINNNEKSQENQSNAKEYMIQTTRLFFSKLKEKELPFLKGKEQGSIIIIKPQAVRDAATGKAFTGYPQLMAQALIQAVYEQKKIPELEYELITYDQAKACGTFIKKGSPHITLTNYNPATNAASKQMYYFKWLTTL